MKKLIEKPEEDCVIRFGTSGWSSYFMASLPKNYDSKYDKCLWDRANKLVPESVKLSGSGNKEVKWLKIFRFEKNISFSNNS